MLSGSIPLGRLAGASLRIHWSAVVVAVFFTFGLASQEQRATGEALGVLPAVIGVVAFFASILGHELAHAVVARRYGVGTTAIELWALGGFARLDREPRTPRAEGWIAAAGPLASLAMGGLAIGAAFGAYRLGAPEPIVPVMLWIGLINVALGVFNLLPGSPLDGGRIVRAVRWSMTGNRYRAMREAGHAGRVIGWGLGALGLGLMVGRPARAVGRRHRRLHRLQRQGRDRLRRGQRTARRRSPSAS